MTARRRSPGSSRFWPKNDRIVATYREHGHALVRGVPMTTVMAEMYGKAEGCSGGRGGSMHLFDKATNFYGGNAIVGGGLPLAGGLALGRQDAGADGVTACFFGEGAVAEGEFHETLNLAGAVGRAGSVCLREQWLRHGLGPRAHRGRDRHPRQGRRLRHRLRSGRRHGRGRRRGGRAPRRRQRIRETGAPYFLECRTYRFRAHSMFDASSTATRKRSRSGAKGADRPLPGMAAGKQSDHEDDIARSRPIDAEIAEAVAFAEAGTWEPVET
jgi:2-oxoisovalerate dehydrogenase E1 component